MKVKRMGITENLRRIWLFSANKIKSSESFSKQPTQLIVELNSSLQYIIVTIVRRLMNHIVKTQVDLEKNQPKVLKFAMSSRHFMIFSNQNT